MKHPAVYILGTFYVWTLALIFYLTELPCKNYDTVRVLHFVNTTMTA